MKFLNTIALFSIVFIGCNSIKSGDNEVQDYAFQNIGTGNSFEYRYEDTLYQKSSPGVTFVSTGKLILKIDSMSQNKKNLWATGNIDYTTEKYNVNDPSFDSTLSSTSVDIDVSLSILDSGYVQETTHISGCCFSFSNSLFPLYVKYKDSQKSAFTINYSGNISHLFQTDDRVPTTNYYDSSLNILAYSELNDVHTPSFGKLFLTKINLDSVKIKSN